jgi:hypothetical protein
MKTHIKTVICVLAAEFVLLGPAMAVQNERGSAADKEKIAASKTGEVTPPPSAQDIANAKSQGLVWVNLNSRVYYKDGQFYGKTKHGKFITENEAQKQGFREAKDSSSKKGTKKKQPDQSGIDSTVETHSSTPPKP